MAVIANMTDDYVYVSIKDGPIRGLVVDDPTYPKDTAKRVAQWVRMGHTVERFPRLDAVKRMKAEYAARSSGGWDAKANG